MTVSIPMKNLSHIATNACDSNTPPIKTVIVNVQASGQTLVQQMDYKAGQPFDFKFDKIQSGTVLVQVLGIYGSDGGGMQIKYADQSVSVNGAATANIDLANQSSIFTIKKQSYLAGRIQLADGTFPSGTLLAKFTPPGGKPSMIVDQKSIVSGWFNIFAVSLGTGVPDTQQPLFDYFWVESPTPTVPLFSGLNPDINASSCAGDEASTMGACPFQVFSDRMKVHKPSSYSRSGNSQNPGLQTNSEVEYVLGYFGALGGMSNKVCYASDMYEAIPRLFSAGADMTATCTLWQTPMDVDFTTAPISAGAVSNAKIEYMGGGTGTSSSQLYTLNDSNCSGSMLDTGGAMMMNHTLLGDQDENFGGFSPPWRMIQPFANNGSQYVSVVANRQIVSYISASGNQMIVTTTVAPLMNSGVSGPIMSQGTIITNVTGTPNNWTVTLNQNLTGSGGGVAELSPQLQVNWKLIGNFTTPVPTGTATIGSDTYSDATVTPAPIVGSYADTGGPFPAGSQLIKVTPRVSPPNHYDLQFSQQANTISGEVFLNPFSAQEVWARYNLNLSGMISGNQITGINPPLLDASMAGMSVSGTGIPQDAIISSATANTITLNVPISASGNINFKIGGSGWSNIDDCFQLPKYGFQLVTTLAPSAAPSFTFTGNASNPYLPPAGPNVGYQFAICAARGAGVNKTYLGSLVMGQQSFAGDNNNWPFGWASANVANNLAPTAPASNESGLKIANWQMTSISQPNVATTQLVLNTMPSVDVVAGKEIMIRVVGMGTSPGCGPGVNVGDYTFARVLKVTSSQVSIPSGTWVDRLLGLADLNASPTPGTPFCFVQVVYVPHFRNLTLASGYTTSFASNGYDFSTASASNNGVAVFRVDGLLSIGGSISVAGSGYAGGVFPSQTNGAGIGGTNDPSNATGTGGKVPGVAADGGGGGGGYGSAGNGSSPSNATGGAGFSYNNQFDIIPGSGGGSAGAVGSNGGNGGGVLYIAANQMLMTNAATNISADGSVSTQNGGGGGGGSINFLVNNLSGTGNISLSAAGGMSAGSGGGGGGGFINFTSCSSQPSIAVTSNVAAGITTSGNGTGATIGRSSVDANNSGSATGIAQWCQ